MGTENQVMLEDVVIFHDAKNEPHNALITAVWGQDCVNLVYVMEPKDVAYYANTVTETSVTRGRATTAPGRYFRYADEPVVKHPAGYQEYSGSPMGQLTGIGV